MRVVWSIFLRDIRRILRNPVALVVTLGVAVIPCLYAWFNIAANWDPYTNTGGISVAIVNEDRGADVGSLGHTNAGEMVVEALKQNDQLGWTFVDKDTALEGVWSGRYYAAIVMPADFTSSLADVLDGDTSRADLDYYVNEKVNPIAPKVTDTGSSTIEQQIDENFASVVSGVVVDRLQGASQAALDDADAAASGISQDLANVHATLTGLTEDLDSVEDTIDSAEKSLAAARATLLDVSSSVTEAQTGLTDALGAMPSARSDAQQLSAQLIAALNDGSTTLTGISSRANASIGEVSGRIGGATGRLESALDTLGGYVSEAQQVEDQIRAARERIAASDIPDGAAKQHALAGLDDLAERAASQRKAIQGQLDTLSATVRSVEEGNRDVEELSTSVNDAIQGAAGSLADLEADYTQNTMPQISSALDSFSDVSGQLAGGLGSIGPLVTQSVGTLDQLTTTLDESKAPLASTRQTLAQATSDIESIQTDLAAIRGSEAWQTLSDVTKVDKTKVTEFMKSPVTIDESPIYPVANYGSGIAPFFTSVALWVGGIALIVIFKLEVDDEGVGEFLPWQGYLGRLLTLLVVGQLQAIACCTGNLLIGIQCVSPLAYYLAAMVASFCFVNVIFALTVAFKHIGRACAFLLIVLQVPGSSGMYPIEMMPHFFQAICPWLPFTYSNNAMREAIGGFYGNYYAHNLAMLLLFVAPALLVGVACRRHLLNINALFDRRLRETDFIVAEHEDMNEAHFKLSTIIKVLLSSQDYKQVFLERSAAFELKYPLLIRRGILAVFVVPLALLVLLYALPYKLPMLVLWIVSLIAICTYLIVVEYLHSRVGEKTALADMSRDQLYDMLDESLKHEFLAFAPIEKLRSRQRASEEDGHE